jgi:hypothetical protein
MLDTWMDSARAFWAELVQNPPMLVSLGCVALAAMLALLLYATRSGRVRVTRLTPDEKKRRPRPAIARSIAAQGVSAREIARRSRMSHDAVAILLDRSARLADRKTPPSAARIAASAGTRTKDVRAPRGD